MSDDTTTPDTVQTVTQGLAHGMKLGLSWSNQPDVSERHPYVTIIEVLGPKVYRRNSVAAELGAHGLHYGGDLIAGTGGWQQDDGTYAIFRAYDHAQRMRNNMLFMGMTPPDVEQIVNAMLLQAGVSIDALTSSKDVYLRTFALAEAIQLGVGSPSKGIVGVLSRDLTDYLPETGVNLLVPGHLLRRTGYMNGLPYVKVAANYALPLVWKQIAAKLGCQEVLHMEPVEGGFSETSGSIPLYILKPGNTHNYSDKVTLMVPPPESGRLNSITLNTVMQLANHLGWTVVDNQPITHSIMHHADEMWLCGTWSGMVPVRQLWYDQRFMPRATGRNGHPPEPPMSVFANGVGTGYVEWLANNFNPEPHETFNNLSLGTELSALYWAVVRNRPSELSGFAIPPEWHNAVERLEVVPYKGEL